MQGSYIYRLFNKSFLELPIRKEIPTNSKRSESREGNKTSTFPTLEARRYCLKSSTD